MNRQGVFGDLHRTVRNFHDPEETVGQSPRTEIMKLGRQTDVPEVESYLHEGALRPRRFCGARTDGIRCFTPNVFPLINADVGYDDVLFALIVHRHATCVAHSRDTTKIRDAVGIRIYGIQQGSLVGRTGKELVCQPVPWHNVSTRDRNWLNGEIGYWFDLSPQRDAEGEKEKEQVAEARSHCIFTS